MVLFQLQSDLHVYGGDIRGNIGLKFIYSCDMQMTETLQGKVEVHEVSLIFDIEIIPVKKLKSPIACGMGRPNRVCLEFMADYF